MTADPILADLNDAQREAVTYTGGPLLVVAGAGTGKTRVITRRIAWRIQQGLRPSQVLAITFTNKAAGEMRTRVEDLIGPSRIWISTFHAMGARLLRMEAEAAGLDRNFTIFDAADQLTVVRDVLRELGLTGRDHKPRDYLSVISNLKSAGELPPPPDETVDDPELRAYREYDRVLRESQGLDFDDLLLRPVLLLEQDADVRARFVGRFATLLIDEYQDTNRLQYRMARIVAAGHGDICATGDPDQSIYRWRGADIRNILEFERDFPNTRVVKLEENYRSSNRILRAATAVISNNRSRIERDLRSSLGDGEPIAVIRALSEDDEARRVVQWIEQALRDGYRLSDVALFYRTNSCSRTLERALRFADLPYVIIGAVAFYERREVKDLLAYLRVLANPYNSVDLARVINVPTRGIGLKTVARLKEAAAADGVPLRDLVLRDDPVPGLRANSRAAVHRFADLLRGLLAVRPTPVLPVLDEVLRVTDYTGFLVDLGEDNVDDRLENVEELRQAVYEFDQREGGTLEEFLNETALLRSREDQEDPATERVTMMTLHSAKGLEFPAVFITSIEEGMLPHSRSSDTEDGVEEERRLMYVGITRARQRLALSYAASRSGMGERFGPSIPSRFLAELPPEEVEREGDSEEEADYDTGFEPDTFYEPEYGDEPPFGVGDEVIHDTFGVGRVLRLSGFGPAAKITVRFERFGEKRLILEYARLRKAYY